MTEQTLIAKIEKIIGDLKDYILKLKEFKKATKPIVDMKDNALPSEGERLFEIGNVKVCVEGYTDSLDVDDDRIRLLNANITKLIIEKK
jgi:hypothetical protein